MVHRELNKAALDDWLVGQPMPAARDPLIPLYLVRNSTELRTELPPPEPMLDTRIDVLIGEQAFETLRDHRFLRSWLALHESCAHASAFQSPGFVCTWYEAYRAKWEPVVVRAVDVNKELVGLWLLARTLGTNELAHAGSHQAEYHTWIASPGRDAWFVTGAWTQLRRQVAFASLRFKYLPSIDLARMLESLPGLGPRAIVRVRSRPLMCLDPAEVRATSAKKSNKSRFNRIRKLGKFEFRRVTDRAEVEKVFDELVACYDLRQGAIHQVCPFREDVHKRRFYSEYFAAAPDEVCFTVSYLDERPVAAFWGAVGGTTVHLGMLIHSPMLAEHSPGKLHIMQLCEHLLADRKCALDLTPGGDPWKERFATSHDEVADVIIHGTVGARKRAEALEAVIQWGKERLAKVDITPDKARSALRRLRRARPSALARRVWQWTCVHREFRVYRSERTLADGCAYDVRVSCNSLSDLLAFEPGESWQSRDAFLSSALARLEQGESVYTVNVDNRLAHCGWMAMNQKESHMSEIQQSMNFPEGSVALYDFYSNPDFRGRGFYRATLRHMLRRAFDVETTRFAYISALADNLPSRHVIEEIGFGYVGSFFLERRLGVEKKWASLVFGQSENADA